MKQLLSISAFLYCLSAGAQTADSLRIDSIMQTLPDLVVKGERPIATVKGATITYDLPRLIAQKGIDNVYDAVKELPGVIEQGGSLSLGGLKTTIVLEGKVTTLTAEEQAALLRSLPASRIEKAEVMYNAPAKTQVKGALINIRLRRQPDDFAPLQGEVNLAWNQQHDARFGQRATLLYRQGRFSMDLMYLHSHGRHYSTTDEQSHHTLADGSEHDISLSQAYSSHGYGHTVRFGMDYDLAENHRLSLVYNGDYQKQRGAESLSGSVTGATINRSHNHLHNLRMDYQAPFGLSASAEMTYYRHPETQSLTSTLPTGTLRYEVDDRQKINRWKFFLSQARTLPGNWGLNYGAVYTSSINHSGQIYTALHTTTGYQPTSTGTRLREEDVSLYAGFSKDFSPKVSLEASISGEYYHTPVWHQWYFYPTFSLVCKPSAAHYLQLSLSKDRSYPDYWAMTAFTTYSNGGYSEITGNPDLHPSSAYQLQLVYLLKQKYTFVAWFSHIDDYFTQTPYQRPDRLTMSYRNVNFDYQEQAGLQATLPFKAGRRFSSRLSLLGVWQHERASHYYDIPFDRRIVWTMLNLRNTLTLSTCPDITLSADGMVRTKAIQAIYDLPASGNLDLSARWMFWRQRAILRVFCNDLFETSMIHPEIDYRTQRLSMDFGCFREFGVSFTYKFGGYKERQHKAVDTSRFKQ